MAPAAALWANLCCTRRKHFRALVRADEIWLVVLASGRRRRLRHVRLRMMSLVTNIGHEYLFNLQFGDRLSGSVDLERMRAVGVPAIGGLLVGLTGWAISRWWNRPDGGPDRSQRAVMAAACRSSDSLFVTAQTVLSNCALALRSGWKPAIPRSAPPWPRGSAVRSGVRRNDLRLLVGCGAAGGIAAAFQAPLTGSFYAFELVIGTYSLATLAPVVVSAIAAVIVTPRAWHRLAPGSTSACPPALEPVDYLPVLALGMACALGGIAIMRGVTLVESWFRRSGVPVWLRPAIGG